MQEDTFKSNAVQALAITMFSALHSIEFPSMPIGQEKIIMAKKTNPVVKPLITSKPTKAQREAAKNTPIKMVEAHTLLGGSKSPYKALTKNRADFAAWIIAAMITSSYITVSAAGTPKKAAGKSQPSLLRALIGATAWGHWHKTERLDCIAAGKDDSGKVLPEVVGIALKGLNEVQARLAGTSKGYNTDVKTVQLFSKAMKAGGKVDTGLATYNLDSPIAVKRA